MILRSDTQFSAINLLDSGEKGHIMLVSSESDGPAAQFTGRDLKSRVSIAALNNNPDVQLYDGQERIRAEVGMAELGPMIRVYGSNSDTRAVLGVADDVPTALVGGPEKGSVMMTAKRNGEILIFKPDGKTVVWAAPR